jgi:hypothetical protein
VREETILGKVDFGSAENYWLNRTEMSEPVVELISKTNEVTRQKIKAELLEECNPMLRNGKLIMNCSSIIISAEK